MLTSFPQSQSSKQAREDVEESESPMSTPESKDGQGSGDSEGISAEKAEENRHSVGMAEPHLAPNVDYLREKDYLMMYPRYEKAYMESISPKHQAPQEVSIHPLAPFLPFEAHLHLPGCITKLSIWISARSDSAHACI